MTYDVIFLILFTNNQDQIKKIIEILTSPVLAKVVSSSSAIIGSSNSCKSSSSVQRSKEVMGLA